MLSPKEQIKASVQAKKAHRAMLRQELGNPVEGLTNLLAHIPQGVIEQQVWYDEDGFRHVKRMWEI